MKQIVGGNIESYATVCEEPRVEAYRRMVKHAQEKGADAIGGPRSVSSQNRLDAPPASINST
jgi:uncharacterized protein YbjQ (UPF0145 family)